MFIKATPLAEAPLGASVTLIRFYDYSPKHSAQTINCHPAHCEIGFLDLLKSLRNS